MFRFSEEIKKTTARLYLNDNLPGSDDNFLGSGVIFLLNDEIYTLTAGHNIYGIDFDENPLKDDLVIKDKDNNTYKVDEIKGNIEFIRQHDITLLKLSKQEVVNELICLQFCSRPTHPEHSFIFRGTYKRTDNNEERTMPFDNLKYRTTHDSISKFIIKSSSDELKTIDNEGGSEWMSGFSGSGLFYQDLESLVCCGIFLEIPDRGIGGELIFSDIKIIEKLGINLQVENSDKFDIDKALNASTIARIFREINEKTVEDWENTDKNNSKRDNIDRKLRVIYPTENIKRYKVKIIKNLLRGGSFVSILSQKKYLYEIYQKAYMVFDEMEEKEFWVKDEDEASEKFKLIGKEYQTHLQEVFDKKLDASDIKIIEKYGISEWLANCSLNFILK
jgi:hypothetical protein